MSYELNMIDFNGLSTHLVLFYAKGLGNLVKCTFIFRFTESSLTFLPNVIWYQVFRSNIYNFHSCMFLAL